MTCRMSVHEVLKVGKMALRPLRLSPCDCRYVYLMATIEYPIDLEYVFSG